MADISSMEKDLISIADNMKYVYEVGLKDGSGDYWLDVEVNGTAVNSNDVSNALSSNKISKSEIRVVKFPEEVQFITVKAFTGFSSCNMFIPLYRSNKVSQVDYKAFKDSSLKIADLRNCYFIYQSAFEGCSKLETVYLKEDVDIGYHAFKDIGSSAYVKIYPSTGVLTNYQCLTTDKGKPVLLHSLSIDPDYTGFSFKVPETVMYVETDFCTNPDALGGLTMPEHHCFQEAHFLKGASNLTVLQLYDLTYGNEHGIGNVQCLGELFTEDAVSNVVNFNKTHVPLSLKELTICGGSMGSNCLRGAPFKKLTVGTHFKCTLGANVTRDCASLEEFNIGKYVTSISTGIFNRCTSLSKVTIDPENPKYYYSENDHGIIEKGTDTLNAAFVPVGTSSLTLGTDCETVKKLSVHGIPHLTSLTVNSKIKHIDDWFLDDCIKLGYIYADTDYYKTYSVKNPDSGYVHSGALYGKNANDTNDEFTHLLLMPKELTYAYNFTYYVRNGTKTIAACAFKGCQTQGITYVIPNSVVAIASNAFQDLHDCTIQFKGNYENIDGYVTRWGAKDTVTFENI